MGFGVVNSRFRPPSTSGPDAPSDVTPPYDDAAAREVYADPFISSTGHEKTGGLEVAMEGFKGILVKGKNSNEYLLGIGPRESGQQKERPTIWRRADGNGVQLPETCEASMTIRDQLGRLGVFIGLHKDVLRRS